jgi:ketosteroid isomerase-like protein
MLVHRAFGLLSSLVLVGSPLPANVSANPAREAAAAPAADALATVTRFAAALKSGDRAGVLACLAPDVVIFEHGGAEMSREEYAQHHLDGDLEYLRAIEVRVVDRRVLNAAERVVVLTRSESSGEFRGKPVASSGTETLVLERRDGSWVIVHVHWSSGKRG